MKCVFIANPKSGKGKILRYKDYILNKLSEKFSDIIWLETEYAGHATILARQYGSECDYLLFSGGDGTLNEIVNGVIELEEKPVIGQIPSGTVNDFSRSLGIKKNIKKSLKQLLILNTKKIDIFTANGKYGVYICGFGVFTKTSYDTGQDKKKHFGWLSYFFNGIKEIKTYSPQTIVFKTKDYTFEDKVALFLVINSKSVGGFKFNKTAKLDDEKLDLVVFKAKKSKICFSDLIRIAKLFLFGIKAVKKSRYVYVSQIEELACSSSSEISLNFDGEHIASENHFELKICKGALNVLAK